MEDPLVTQSNSNEDFIIEKVEICHNLSNTNLDEAIDKVMRWFSKNDQFTSAIDFDEKSIDLHSSKESDELNEESIKTPSVESEFADSDDYFRESSENIIFVKAPVIPIKLKHQVHYNVNIINFQSIDSFFVTINRENDRKWNRLMRRLNNLQERNNLEPLQEVIRGSLCLVKVDGELHRAIVQNSNEKLAICFGIDTGKLYMIDMLKDFIYYMSPKIRNTIEFQAINCKLFDIRLPHDPQITNIVYDTVISKIKNPQIKVIKTKSSRFINDNCLSFNLYDVMLYDFDNMISINQQIAHTIQGMKDYDLDNF